MDAHRTRNGQFLLTGSQKFTLMKNVSESLAGGADIVELETLSLAEIQAALPQTGIETAIVRGGFPELYANPDIDSVAFYNSYLATYLERDVRSLTNVGSLRDFERFLRACALRSANLLNKADLARDVGIAPSTANHWLSMLEASGQIVLLEPWFSNRTKSIVKSPKLYLSDTGLLCALLNIRTEEVLRQSPAVGAVWETFVFSQLRDRERRAERTGSLFFWRDRTREVDFVVDTGGRLELFEAKWTRSFAAHKTPFRLRMGFGRCPSVRPTPNPKRHSPGRRKLGYELERGKHGQLAAQHGFSSNSTRAIPTEFLPERQCVVRINLRVIAPT